MSNVTTSRPAAGTFAMWPVEKVLWGPGSIRTHLVDEVNRLGTRVAIITGRTLATKTDVIKNIEALLGERHAVTFSEIKQHTPVQDIRDAMVQLQLKKADILLSVGGGSPIDATKAIKKLLADDTGRHLPHIAIPTTLSAAEYTPIAGYTNEEGNKVAVFTAELVPSVIILDSELTLSTPQRLWSSTGMRAVDHAVETFYSPGFPHPVEDSLAAEALRKLFHYLPASKADPTNLTFRQELQLASFLSIFPSSSMMIMGVSHMFGHKIGATYGIPHGITSCITLPHVMRFMSKHHPSRVAMVTRAVTPERCTQDDQHDAALSADLIQELIDSLGLTSKLRDYQVPEGELEKITQRTKDDAKKYLGDLVESESFVTLAQKMY